MRSDCEPYTLLKHVYCWVMNRRRVRVQWPVTTPLSPVHVDIHDKFEEIKKIMRVPIRQETHSPLTRTTNSDWNQKLWKTHDTCLWSRLCSSFSSSSPSSLSFLSPVESEFPPDDATHTMWRECGRGRCSHTDVTEDSRPLCLQWHSHIHRVDAHMHATEATPTSWCDLATPASQPDLYSTRWQAQLSQLHWCSAQFSLFCTASKSKMCLETIRKRLKMSLYFFFFLKYWTLFVHSKHQMSPQTFPVGECVNTSKKHTHTHTHTLFRHPSPSSLQRKPWKHDTKGVRAGLRGLG